MSNNLCYIVIVFYDSLDLTIKCIESILKSKDKRYKIIIVNNGSKKRNLLSFENYLKKSSLNESVCLLLSTGNYGYGHGVNLGIKFSLNSNNCKYLWILNNDIKIDKYSLSMLIDSSDNNSIISPVIYDYYNKKSIQSRGGLLNPYMLTTEHLLVDNKSIDYLTGASLFFKKEIIKSNGYFSEKYFMYYEDVEWCIRARKNNINLKVIDGCKVFHEYKRIIPFKLKVRSQFNRLRLCYDHYFYRFPLVLFGVLISLMMTCLKRIIFHSND